MQRNQIITQRNKMKIKIQKQKQKVMRKLMTFVNLDINTSVKFYL